jgi:CheY-like chemotaxis protein
MNVSLGGFLFLNKFLGIHKNQFIKNKTEVREMTGKKIMIVDDDKIFLEELEEILILNGYFTIAIHDSTSALDIAKTQRPDLIILDMKMDGMNGFQLADSLKRIQATAHIPIIGTSAIFRIENNLEDNFFLMDFCYMLHKPINPLELIDKIEKVLLEDKINTKQSIQKHGRDIRN